MKLQISWAKMAFALAATSMVLGATPKAIAQQQASEVKVDLTLKDADLVTATKALTARTGIQFLMKPSVVEYSKITLSIKGVTPEEAVRYICMAAGASYQRDDTGVFSIGPIEKTPVVPPAELVPTKVKKVFRAIKVLKAGARDVFDQIVYRIPFDSNRGFLELKRFAALSQADSTRIFGQNISNINAVQTQNFRPIPNNPTSAPLTGAESGNDIAIPGESAGQAGFGGGGGRQGGGGGGIGGGGGQGLGGGGQGGQGGGNTQLIGGQGLVPESIDFISYDPTDNSIVVRGNEDDINQLQQYINVFDVAPKQVIIKVEFITTTQTLDKSLGYEFLFQRGTVFAGTRPGVFVRQSDPIFLNYTTGNIAARLRASLSEGSGKVVTAPILRTLNNQPASITSSLVTTIFVQQTTINNNLAVNSTIPQQLNATTGLSVAPRINDDGTITLTLNPQISNFVGFSRGPNGEEIPNQSTQIIQVTARVKNGETIVLGGLTTKNESSGSNRVPVLSDLPIIGQFFRTSNKQISNGELLIFVTPTVVDDELGTPGTP